MEWQDVHSKELYDIVSNPSKVNGFTPEEFLKIKTRLKDLSDEDKFNFILFQLMGLLFRRGFK